MSTVESRQWPWQSSGPVAAGLLALRLAIGWHFFYEGISKLLATGWSSERYLSTAEWIFGGAFQAIARTPWMVGTADILNAWGLTIIGLCLFLGALTRLSCISGTVLLLLYTLVHPALPGMAGATIGGGSYLIVDRNIVEALALIMIGMLPPGQLWGLDRLMLRRRLQRTGGTETEADEETVKSSGRRELIRDLTGVPVLGAMAAAILGGRAASDATAGVDALSGATPLLNSPAVIGGRGNIVSVRDFERLAPNHMTPINYAYVAGGNGDEQTLRWSEAAFRQIHLRQQVLHSQTVPDTRVQLLGRELPHPIMIAPARQTDVHPEGELATVRGAGEAGAVMIVSSMATKTIESIAEAASQPIWYQAYLFRDPDRGRSDRARENVQRAEAAGYEAICVTLDSSSNGPRDSEYRLAPQRNPERFTTHNGRPWTWPTTWDDFEWYRSLTKLPIIPKGIMNVEDALRSLELGADAIYISNHGGRVFDSGIAPIQVLPAIVDAVAGRVPIIVDGGIRRGTDVLKALALGATTVAIGKPFLYGLAVDGAEGVSAVINMLWNELEMAMVSTGQQSIVNLDRQAVLTTPVTQSGSSFFTS